LEKQQILRIGKVIADVSNSNKIVVEKLIFRVKTAEAIEKIHRTQNISTFRFYRILNFFLFNPNRVLIGGIYRNLGWRKSDSNSE